MMEKIRSVLVGVGELNRPIGENHPRARLTDAEVEDIRTLWEEGFTLAVLVHKYGDRASRETLRSIVYYRRRAAPMVGTVRRYIKDDEQR